MKQLKQSGKEWMLWRHKGIGSSDAAATLGESPYKTTYQLWEEKILDEPDLEKEKGKSFIFAKGHRLEPKARALYELEHSETFNQELFERVDFPFMKASVDGFNKELNRGIEIKYVGKNAFEAAQNGDVPKHYHIQMQHQILVTGADAVDYVAYNDELDKIAIVHVKPDVPLLKKLHKAEIKFWEQVQSKTPPDFQDKDFRVIRDKDLKYNLLAYKHLKTQMKIAEEKLEVLKVKIIAKANFPRMRYDEIKIQHGLRKGSVQYGKIPELKGVDLDKYRKAATKSFRIDV